MSIETPSDILNPKPPAKLIAGAAVGVAALVVVLTSFYQVAPDERGIVQRFGRYVRTTDPGLHAKLPLAIERVTRIKTTHVYKEEFGFRTHKPGIRTTYAKEAFQDESLMLTGDLNMADVEWIVQFRFAEPAKVLFRIGLDTARQTVRDLSEAVMRQIVGDSSVDEVLTLRRAEIGREVQKLLQEALKSYDIGVEITTVKLQDVNPPEQVKPAFEEVNAAKQDKERMINEAQAEYNKVIPRAKGEADQTVSQARAYATERVNEAQGDALRFKAMLAEYRKAEEVTRRRLFLEAMDKVLANADRVIIVDPQARSILNVLDLTKEGGGQ